MLKDRNTDLLNFSIVCGGEARGPLKILRNRLFPTPKRFLWYLLYFSPLLILGRGRGGSSFFHTTQTNVASCVVVYF